MPSFVLHPLRGLLPAAVSMACVSCVLPFPHRTVVRERVKGRVVSAATGSPVMGAEVKATFSGPVVPTETHSVPASGGNFTIPGVHRWHWGYLIGPISYSIPYSIPGRRALDSLEASAPDHGSFVWKREDGGADKPPRTIRLQPIATGSGHR